jgi:hypothetical protein
MENHTYNLTTEEPRYEDDDTMPKLRGPAKITRREVWYPAGEWKDYKKPWVKMPAESLEALYLDHFQNDSDAAAYDYIVAQHSYHIAYPDWEQPDNLPELITQKWWGDYTKKDSGAAYAWEDRGDWDDEERTIVPPVKAELPPWYLHVPEVTYKKYWRIIEPRFSQSVLRALLEEHAALEAIEDGYDCAVAAEQLGVYGEDLPRGMSYKEALTTSSGNLTVRKPEQGGIRAIPYNEKECGMSEECLIALEGHFLDLEQDDCDYWHAICKWELETKLPTTDEDYWWWSGASVAVSNAFGPCKQTRFDPEEIYLDRRVNIAEEFSIEDLTRFRNVNLLKLPINAQAATYYDVDFNNPKAIIAKFERVDISTIPAENMTCMCCLDDFEEAEDNESGDDESDDDKSDSYWVPFDDGFAIIRDDSDDDDSDDDDSDDDDSDDDDSDDAEAEDHEAYDDDSDDDDSNDDDSDDDDSDDDDSDDDDSDDDDSDDAEAEDHEADDAEAEDNEADDEADSNQIKLSTGKVRFDNSPVKLSCPHGHLIGKTCMMQILDAGMRTCPMCRFVIYTPRDPRDEDHPGLPLGVNIDNVILPYSVWD